MKLVSKFFREQKRYTKNDLKHILEFDDTGVERLIKNLKSFGVLKCVEKSSRQFEMTDLLDDDVEIVDSSASNEDCLYVFTYVGIIILGNRIIKVFPKYLLSTNVDPLLEMKQVLKVLEKYSHSEEQIINLFNGDAEERSFNTLAVILFLLRDYYQYGIYTNYQNVYEVNGEGSIFWEKTIDENYPLIRNNRPYYIEVITEKKIDDEFDYFTRLHECVLTKCSQMLHESQLDSLFDLDELVLSEEDITDFGDREYILYKIEKELDTQFNTRRQILLKTIYAYILQDRKLLDENDGVSLFGTNAFHAIWEAVCAEIFDNKLKTPLDKLGLGMPIEKTYNSKQKLIQIIEKPEWISDSLGAIQATDTLIPDLVSFFKIGKEDYFIIFDAKYYNVQLEHNKPLRGVPGIGDITKQYLYQLAYNCFIEKHNIKFVRNCFLMPTEKKSVIYKGYVRLEMLENLGLENIHVFQIPAFEAFDCYLSKRKFDMTKLHLERVK